MSLGFCRENFDCNKNAIIENKGKDYWVLDLFDGETYSHNFTQYIKYIDDTNLVRKGDVIGAKIDLDSGQIEFYKNGQPLGVAFDEGASGFKKGKVFPFLQLYKCKVSVYQTTNPATVNTIPNRGQEENKNRVESVYAKY